jgi:hypothetical protein
MRLLALIAAWVFALSASAFAAPAPSPTPPPTGADSIKILACSLEYNSLSGNAAKMHVDFTNLNTLPVTHIRFRVRAVSSTFAVMDIGSFAPNVKIHHDLDPPMADVLRFHGMSMPPEMGGLGCAIDAYTLSNGYTWISPQLQAELQQQQQKTH